MACIDQVFRPGPKKHMSIQRHYPHVYKPEYAKRLLLLHDKGHLVGHLAIHPLPIRLEDVTLKVGGLGCVGALPERRGEGIMTTLLSDAIARMRRSGYALSALGGDRQRYGWFGWENAGMVNRYTLSTRYLAKPSRAERVLKIEAYASDPSINRRIRKWGEQHLYWQDRPMADIPLLLKRPRRRTWICREGNRFAYVCIYQRQENPQGRNIDEAGGDPELVAAILRRLLGRFGQQQISASAGPNPLQLDLFHQYSDHWARHTDCMLKIIDLPMLVQALEPLLKRKAHRAGVSGVYHFKIAGTQQTASLKLRQGRSYTIQLSEQEMVSLFFGIHPLTDRYDDRRWCGVLKHILPLPFYWPGLNHI
jgi:GNAT superfamily N-acetyltransferase